MSAKERKRKSAKVSQPQSITQKGVHTHPWTARERECWFFAALGPLLAANFGGRQSREHPFVRYFGALPQRANKGAKEHKRALPAKIPKQTVRVAPLQNSGRPRFGSVRLRFGGGTVRAVPVLGSGGSSAKGVFLCFSRV